MDIFYWIAIAAITVVSSARITRLATHDAFPPIVWLRDKYADATDGTGWQLLAFCPYCASFWITAAVALIGYFTDFHEAWVLVNSIFAASYAAAILVARDIGAESDHPTFAQSIEVHGAESDFFPVIENAEDVD